MEENNAPEFSISLKDKVLAVADLSFIFATYLGISYLFSPANEDLRNYNPLADSRENVFYASQKGDNGMACLEDYFPSGIISGDFNGLYGEGNLADRR